MPEATEDFPSASAMESARFNFLHLVPNLLQGLFLRHPGRVAFFTRRGVDGKTIRLCQRLKRKYGDRFYLRVFTKKALLLTDAEAIRQVLEKSPRTYGPPEVKVKGMSRFQPGAATISQGEEWEKRRRFNEGVLDSGQALHRHAGPYLTLIREEVARARAKAGKRLAWKDFAELFERITLGIVFGPGAREETAITGDLATLMREGNPPTKKGDSPVFQRFTAALHRHLASPQEGSLVALAAAAPADEGTRVSGQVPHWVFAMKDTLAANTARTLAVIASHPEVEARVRQEMAGTDLGRAEGIAGLAYLEGCVHEAMRLWPTTPLLSRLTLQDDEIGGRPVPAGTQILILNLFNHRDSDAHSFADSFHPEPWLAGERDVRFNHFSNGPQGCAGMGLALFIARAVLAGLLEGGRYSLEEPRLDPAAPLPPMLDAYSLRWSRLAPGDGA